ncbi:hypothetical protein TNCV_2772061 [Trichonephila clavipes]|nr:hypothetical protein TNCV_2772061 [Trichonephila clavipes]
MTNGRTRLHVVAKWTMTGQRYIDEVLLPHVRLFRGAVGDKFDFIDDSRYKMPVLGQVERGASIDLTWGRFWDKWSVERG